MEPNKNLEEQRHMESDDLEDDLWYDEDDDSEERQKEAEEEERAECAASCTCGAWVFGKDGNVYNVADCFCGAE